MSCLTFSLIPRLEEGVVRSRVGNTGVCYHGKEGQVVVTDEESEFSLRSYSVTVDIHFRLPLYPVSVLYPVPTMFLRYHVTKR